MTTAPSPDLRPLDSGAVPHDLDDHPGDPVVVETWLGAPARSYARRPASVLHVLDRAVRLFGERTAFLDGAEQVTWSAFADRVETAAQALLDRGLQPGDAVAVAAGNSLDLATALLACARARLVMVGLNTRLAPAQWDYMTAHMQAALSLAEPRFPLTGAEDLATVLRSAAPRTWDLAARELPDEADTYAVVYTSGTTGRPKASQVVHRCSVHSAMTYQRVLQLAPGDVSAVLFPMYYISAMHAHVLPAMLTGGTCLLLDTPSPREYVDLLRTHHVAWAYAVPSWWRLCVRVEGFRDLPSLRRLGAGGAAFPVDLVDELTTRLPTTDLHDVYGLSETHSPATFATDAVVRDRPGSVGTVLPCMEAEVRDEDGAVLPADAVGRLFLRGSLVTTGYARDPEATAAAVVDGWFDTGDAARIDDGGHVFVVDRYKDMINRGGTKVFPAEVEELLRRHPQVDDAAVVAVADALGGEAIAAFVVTSGEVTAAQVRAWVREGMADYAAPKVVRVLDALPRGATGKTDKHVLRAMLAEG